jgi:hypothetical protein
MDIKVNGNIAVVQSKEVIINDAGDAMDFIASISYEHNCTRVALCKSAVSEDFFKLSTGVAGEVIQKFVNYGFKLAIIGDFSHYTSKPLKDYMYECNTGNHLFFVGTEQEAINKLSSAR